MNLDTLKVFCGLAETKSLSKAAEVNGSAVSQQVRALELKYQVSLVERNRRACGLTPEGRTFHDAARRIVEACQTLGDDLRRSFCGVAQRQATSAVGSASHRNSPSVGTIYRRSSKPSARVTPKGKSPCNICIRLKGATPSLPAKSRSS